MHRRYPRGVSQVVRPVPPFPSEARDAILAWYGERGRPLAFRRTNDPYAVLVSEAMAQQTQAVRAAAYWERWMLRFPTVRDLAAASPADVLRAWAGLGYDRRALALWRAAGVIVERHDGRVPSSVAELEALPGVGPYTARAVAAIAFGAPVGAVDVNVRRVLGRVVAGSAESMGARELQDLADATVPTEQPATWTHAVMDVGATLCRPRVPRCGNCPARPWCVAARLGGEERAPVRTRNARERPAPFASTNRWLRGRILDRLRMAPDGAWVSMISPIGDHDPDKVARAVRAMAADGVAEVSVDDEGTLRARLPLA